MGRERGGWREQQHVIVMGVEYRSYGEEGIATGAIFNDDRLSPLRGKLVGQQPGRDIDARAWTKRNDEPNRALRPLVRLRLRGWTHDNHRSKAKDNAQNETTQTMHDGSRYQDGAVRKFARRAGITS